MLRRLDCLMQIPEDGAQSTPINFENTNSEQFGSYCDYGILLNCNNHFNTNTF